jgi:hypothetical protein
MNESNPDNGFGAATPSDPFQAAKASAMKAAADKLQEIVGAGALRMTVGSLGFATGQALLDWLKATNQPFDASKVQQSA